MVLISEEVRNLRKFRGKKKRRVGGEAAGANGTREVWNSELQNLK